MLASSEFLISSEQTGDKLFTCKITEIYIDLQLVIFQEAHSESFCQVSTSIKWRDGLSCKSPCIFFFQFFFFEPVLSTAHNFQLSNSHVRLELGESILIRLKFNNSMHKMLIMSRTLRSKHPRITGKYIFVLCYVIIAQLIIHAITLDMIRAFLMLCCTQTVWWLMIKLIWKIFRIWGMEPEVLSLEVMNEQVERDEVGIPSAYL